MVVTSTVDRAVSQVLGPSVLVKAFDVLGCFRPGRRTLSLSEIARRTALPKSTAHRVLSMLLNVGAVDRIGDRYRLGVRMFSMGASSTEAALGDLVLPQLERLHRQSGQNVHLAVLRGTDAVYIQKLHTESAFPSPTLPGSRMPAHCTAVGKAMLAFTGDAVPRDGQLERRTARSIESDVALSVELERVRRVGVAFDHGEAVAGLACIGVPVLIGGRVVAGLSIAFPATFGRGEPMIPMLRETATSIRGTIQSAGGAEPVLDLLSSL